MRVEPGTHRHTSTSGMVLSVDRPLSQEQVDLLAQVITRSGQRPDTTFAIELTDEAGVFIEHMTSDPEDGIVDGEIVYIRERVT